MKGIDFKKRKEESVSYVQDNQKKRKKEMSMNVLPISSG